MTKKTEYWALNEREIRDLRKTVSIAGQHLYSELKVLGFITWESEQNAIECSITKQADDEFQAITISLVREKPVEFVIKLNKWKTSKYLDFKTNEIRRINGKRKLTELCKEEKKQIVNEVKNYL